MLYFNVLQDKEVIGTLKPLKILNKIKIPPYTSNNFSTVDPQ